MSENRVKIPKPTIYLRNKFSIRPGLEGRFFEGQQELLRKARPGMTLVAAFGSEPLYNKKNISYSIRSMIHIWQLQDWGSLYDAMFEFSEAEWYTKEIQSLQSEHQDLMVLTAAGIRRTARPNWNSDDFPGYCYLYEEFKVTGRTKLSFLRDINWLAAQARARHCELMWLGTEITGTPSQIAVLWRASSQEAFDVFLREMTYGPAYAQRYARLMLSVTDLHRQNMFPESTERLDNAL